MTEPTTAIISSPAELSSFIANLVDDLSPSKDTATVIALTGPLGAGKTTFVQKLLKQFGVTDSVTSPTYTIETAYKLPEGVFRKAYHIDAYRLDGAEDLEAISFYDRLENPDNLILIEWAKRVSDLLPEDTVSLHFDFGDEETERVITVSYE